MSRIDVRTLSPFEPGGPAAVRRFTRLATSLHATTRASIVRRYLALKVGEPCTEFRRGESERILRAQPFIADAAIVAVPDGKGGTVVRVVTVDETSLLVGGTVSGKSPVVRALRLGERNLAGEAMLATAGWRHGPGGFRDIYNARFIDYQFLGRPYQMALQGSRNELGGSWDIQVSHPFLTDLQRFSWRARSGAFRGYATFVRPGEWPASLEVIRSYSDFGGVRAFGPPRSVLLLGATMSREYERSAATPVLLLSETVVPDTSSALMGRYGEYQSTRANLLVGLRRLRFVRAAAFDAVEGTQDVRTGLQIATLFGRGLKISPSDERDWFVSGDVYAGAGSDRSFAAIELMGERRRDLDRKRWDGILASGRAAWYVIPADRHTVTASAEYSAGSRQRIPFQLTLAARDGGVRGFRRVDVGGGRRLVVRLEDRYRLGHVRQLAALAGAAFVDAGKLWAGDVPFGVTTGVKVSAGVSLMAAVPPRSRRTWRMDVAVPVNDRRARRVQVTFTNHDFTRWFWREPPDVQNSRERSVPSSVYNWP